MLEIGPNSERRSFEKIIRPSTLQRDFNALRSIQTVQNAIVSLESHGKSQMEGR